MEKMSTFPDEMIHIMFRCVMHFHGHQNKMMPFILVDFNNGIEFYNYTCWLTNDIQNHCLPHWVSNHHIGNKDLVLSSHVEISS